MFSKSIFFFARKAKSIPTTKTSMKSILKLESPPKIESIADKKSSRKLKTILNENDEKVILIHF